MIEQHHATTDIMLGEVKREEGTEEVMGAQAGEKFTKSRAYNCDIMSFSKYNYSIMVFDVEAQAITMYLDNQKFELFCVRYFSAHVR